MPLLVKPLHCPHCRSPIDKRLLQQHGQLKTFLKCKPVDCPHCQKPVVFPEKGDNLIAGGLFVSVILAPLLLFWQWHFIDPRLLFVLGIGITFIGTMTQRLDKA